MRWWCSALLIACALAAGPAAQCQALLRQPSFVDDAGQTRAWRLIAGKWGFLTPLTRAAARELDLCAHADPAATAGLRMAPNRLDAAAALTLQSLRACHGAWFEGAPAGVVPETLWRMLLPGRPLPSPLDRVKLLTAGAAALTPDYDQVTWDWARMPGAGAASADPGPILTWGPFKATAGYGCTLQMVLSALMADPATAAIVRDHFRDEAPLLAQLLDRRDPAWRQKQAQILRPVFDDPERREGFRVILEAMSAHAEIRAGYDAYFLGAGGYLAGRMARYYALYARVGLVATEVDFAFFLDRSLDYPPLSDALTEALVPKIMQGGATNWRARRTIAHETPFTSPAAWNFQIGRDAAYWIDAVGQAGLDPAENASWVRNSRLKASDVGLTERAYAPPCAVVFLPACATTAAASRPDASSPGDAQ